MFGRVQFVNFHEFLCTVVLRSSLISYFVGLEFFPYISGTFEEL